MDDNKNIPTTVNEVVNILLSELTIDDKHRIKESSEDDLINFHFGLGENIRNDFGLWEKNSKLLKNCKNLPGDKNLHVDSASETIIKILWERLQKYPPPKIVKNEITQNIP